VAAQIGSQKLLDAHRHEFAKGPVHAGEGGAGGEEACELAQLILAQSGVRTLASKQEDTGWSHLVSKTAP